MSDTKRKVLSAYRRCLKRPGCVRLMVPVQKAYVPLVRSVVRALGDAEREAETRALLRGRFGAGGATGLKALLASAPLEGIDLSRESDFGRE